MIDKFKKFIDDKIYNQLIIYTTASFNINGVCCGLRFFLTTYDEDYEYVKRQICHFIASWDAPIYVSMNPDRNDIVVEIWEN